LLNAVGRGHAIGEFEKGLGKDALTAIDIHNALVVSEMRRRRSDRLLGNALRHGLAFEIAQPFVIRSATAARRSVRRNGAT
jgi:hypothetical protein